ncbi:MAG: hypothetical protein HY243_09860 [Proteobacteria bacterium]|nr:hypothetical protein [Pseudomonadota bacterium]
MRFDTLGVGMTAFALVIATPALAAGIAADCSKGPVPPGSAKGEIAHRVFVPEKATLRISGGMEMGDDKFNDWTLKFSKPEGDLDEAMADVTFLVAKGKKPDGRTFREVPGDIDAQPKASEGLPEVQGWSFADDASDTHIDSVMTEAHSLQLHFGQRKGNTIEGSVYLCTSEDASAWIGGSFTAEITE